MTEPPPLELHEPIPVRIVPTAHGTRPEPLLDDRWSDLDQLRWKAGCLEAETGLRLRIITGGYTRNGRPVRNEYGWSLPRSSGTGGVFRDMWAFINGIEQGWRQARRQAQQEVQQ